MPTSNPLDYLYEEDITGVSPDNKIENELHLVTPGIEAGDFNIIVPKMMPYFKESMVVEHISSGTILVPGVDWQPAHIFDSASFETEWIHGGIYGSILIMNRNLIGQFRLRKYQTLGGEWVLSNDKLLEILANRIADPRTATYEIVSGKPHVFPPTGHNHPTNDWTGFADVVSAVDRMALAIEQQTQTWLDNPPVLMSEYYLKEEAEDVSRDIAEDVFGEKVDEEMAAFNAAINNLQNQLNLGMADRYTKTASDARYYQKSQVYTQSEINTLIANTIANYYTKTETDSRYYLKTETYTRTELDTRYRQRLTGTSQVYIRDSNGAESSIGYTTEATANTVMVRDGSGNVKVSKSAAAADAVNNTRLNEVLASALQSYYLKTETYTRGEMDSRYYQKTETYTRTEMDGRYVQRTVTLTADSGLVGGGSLAGNRTIGIGPAHVPSRATYLDTFNLNAITSPGFYYQPSSALALVGAVAEGGRNYPVQHAGSLTVETSAGVIQTYKTYGGHNRAYQRGLYNGTWSTWQSTSGLGDELRIVSNQLQAFVNGAWRIVWPPQWQ